MPHRNIRSAAPAQRRRPMTSVEVTPRNGCLVIPSTSPTHRPASHLDQADHLNTEGKDNHTAADGGAHQGNSQTCWKEPGAESMRVKSARRWGSSCGGSTRQRVSSSVFSTRQRVSSSVGSTRQRVSSSLCSTRQRVSSSIRSTRQGVSSSVCSAHQSTARTAGYPLRVSSGRGRDPLRVSSGRGRDLLSVDTCNMTSPLHADQPLYIPVVSHDSDDDVIDEEYDGDTDSGSVSSWSSWSSRKSSRKSTTSSRGSSRKSAMSSHEEPPLDPRDLSSSSSGRENPSDTEDDCYRDLFDEDDPDEVEAHRVRLLKREIRRNLRRNFNAAKSVEKWRLNQAIIYKIDLSDFSLESSIAMSEMKKRHVTLTGSDEIRMNDKKYTQMVCEKLWQRRQEEIEKEERRRAEAERDRLRRLLAQGLIRPEDMEGDSLLYREYLRREQAKSRNKRGGKKLKTNKTTHFDEDSPREIEYYTKAPQTPLDLMPSDSPPPRRRHHEGRDYQNSSRPVTRGQESDEESESQENKENDEQQEGEHSENVENGEESAETRDNNDPLLFQLRREETVTGLYDIAEGLVYLSPNKNSKKTTKKEPAV